MNGWIILFSIYCYLGFACHISATERGCDFERLAGQFAEIYNKNKDVTIADIVKIPYWKARIEGLNNITFLPLQKVKMNGPGWNVVSYAMMMADATSRRLKEHYCLGGGPHAAIHLYDYYCIGNTEYVCLQWNNALWHTVTNDWGVYTVIVERKRNAPHAKMYFLNQNNQPMLLNDCVAYGIFKQHGQYISLMFFDAQGTPATLKADGLNVMQIQENRANEQMSYSNAEGRHTLDCTNVLDWRAVRLSELFNYKRGIFAAQDSD